MKNLLIILFLAIGLSARSQVAINTDGSLADSSAMLDVKSTSRGMLIPRMSAVQRDAIVSPATGNYTSKIFANYQDLVFGYPWSGDKSISNIHARAIRTF